MCCVNLPPLRERDGDGRMSLICSLSNTTIWHIDGRRQSRTDSITPAGQTFASIDQLFLATRDDSRGDSKRDHDGPGTFRTRIVHAFERDAGGSGRGPRVATDDPIVRPTAVARSGRGLPNEDLNVISTICPRTRCGPVPGNTRSVKLERHRQGACD